MVAPFDNTSLLASPLNQTHQQQRKTEQHKKETLIIFFLCVFDLKCSFFYSHNKTLKTPGDVTKNWIRQEAPSAAPISKMSAVPLNLHTDVSLCTNNMQRRDKSNSADKRGRDNWTERRQESRQADRNGEKSQIENFFRK